MVRGTDRWIVGPTGKSTRTNVYLDMYIRVCGATVKLDVVTARTWLFGYDAYKHFTHDIDCERNPKLIMKAKVSTRRLFPILVLPYLTYSVFVACVTVLLLES